MVPVYNGIKENQQEINVIHLNIRVGVVVESGDSDHFISNPLTLTELRLQISFEATVQTLTEVQLVVFTAMKKYVWLEHFIDQNIRVGVVVESENLTTLFRILWP